MTPVVVILEVAACLVLLWGLATLRHARALPRPLLRTVALLMATLCVQHVCDAFEASGAGWVDAVSDTVSAGVPFVWAFLLLELSSMVQQRALAAEQAQLAFFFEVVPAAVAVLDARGEVVAASDHWKTAYPSTRLGGPLAGAVPDAPDELRASVELCLREQRSSQVAEVASGGEGPRRWWSWTVTPWTQRSQDRGALVLLADVTAQVEAESSRLRAREQLDTAQRFAAVGELAAGAVHDLNNLLLVLHAHLDLLQSTADDSEENRESLAAMESAVGTATALTRGMMKLARSQSSDRRAVAVVPLVAELVGVLGRALPRTHPLRFEAQAPDDAAVMADPTRLQQLILNLVMNARDAMPRGGPIDVRVGAEAGAILITVSDAGTGIPPEVRERLFTPFFTTKGERGTGLGLAVVKSVVEECGGSIAVRSEPGRGSTFEVRLPLVASASAAAGAGMTVASSAPP